jgi:uncharacterized Zn finger protein (UPF0148 family)
MSDFDKEAERERLREKYERDKEKRASTQRMSELLLKGATMTNQHCDDCGDPIFRWNGREFCPSCDVEDGAVAADAGTPVDGEGDEQATDGAAGEDAGPTGTDATRETTPDAQVDGEADPSTGVAVRTPTDADPASRAPPTNVDTPAPAEAETPAAVTGPADSREDAQARSETATASSDESAADLSAARASLARTLARYADAAEAADDPRRAREFLEAAREAAETLAALRR